MQFVCNRRELQKKLQPVYRVIQAGHLSEKLQSILATIDPPDKLRLYATNATSSVEVTLECQITDTSKFPNTIQFLIPTWIFKEIIESLNTETITCSLPSYHILNIIGGQTAYQITLQNLQDYPLPKSLPPAKNEVYIDSKLFKSSIAKILTFRSVTSSREVLQGVFMDPQGHETWLVATDGFRMGLKRLPLEGIPKSLILPGYSLKSLIAADLGEKLSISLIEDKTSNEVIFKTSDFTFTTSTIQSVYPNYKKIIPDNFIATVRISKEDLEGALKRIEPIAKANNNQFLFALRDNKVILNAKSPEGIVYDEVEAEIEGNDITIALLVNYLVDILAMITGTVTIKLTGEKTPILLTHDTDPDFMCVMMPLVIE